MKKLFVLILPLLLACSNREASNASATSTPENAAAMGASTTSSEETAGANGGELTIFSPELSVKSGETICIDVQVNGFNKLLSMQYTLSWNKNVLEFKEIKGFNLPYLDANDFGLHIASNGLLTCAWIDDSLKGVTLADGSSLYQVCFLAKGKAGEESYFKITDRPTSIEVINLQEKMVPLKKKAGSIKIQ